MTYRREEEELIQYNKEEDLQSSEVGGSSSVVPPSEVLLPTLLGLNGVHDGPPLGLVAAPDLLDLLLHLRVQRGQTEAKLLHRPRAHLQTHIYGFNKLLLLVSSRQAESR